MLESYAKYFANKLDTYLLDASVSPLQRIRNFVEDAKRGMARHEFKRGCLVGNLGQEVDLLPLSYRQLLIEIFESWQKRMTTCLREAQLVGELSSESDCESIAEFFWTGWEGAVSRSKLEQSNIPLDKYLAMFIKGLPK